MKNFTNIFALTLTILLAATTSFAGTSTVKADELVAEGNNVAALSLYRKALKNADNNSTNSIVYKMAKAYSNEGQYKRAEAQYRRLVRRNATNETVKLQFAEVLRKNNKLNEATEVLNTLNSASAKVALAQVEMTRSLVNNPSAFQVTKDVSLNKVNFNIKDVAAQNELMVASK